MVDSTQRYKAYPDYKDSGVEWLDVIPSNWSYSSLRWISKIYAGGTPSKAILKYWENGTVPWLNSGSVNQGLITKPSEYITEEAVNNSSTKWVPSGSLVVALAGQGKTKGMVAQTGIDTTCNQSMAAIVISDIERTRYIYWWLTSNYQNIRNMAGGDLRDGLNLEHLGNIRCPMPDIKEAKKIANFLDYETTKIDILIEKQQRLIELLMEKRQAVISHAVTKGLNPDVPMKDSGVEWLGEVPAHWEVSKLKYYSGIQGGYAFSSQSFSEQGVQVLRIANVYQNRLALERQPTYVSENMVNILPDFVVQSNDILMSLTGTLGKRDYGFAVKVESEGKYLLNQRVAKLNPIDTKINRDFLIYTLWSESYLNQLYSLPSGTKQANLSNSDVLDIWIAIPPTKVEQEEIANKLSQIKGDFDLLVLKAEQAIQLMQERRTALISAAVTGKIDVRDWVRPD